jgi:hypothetical protein
MSPAVRQFLSCAYSKAALCAAVEMVGQSVGAFMSDKVHSLPCFLAPGPGRLWTSFAPVSSVRAGVLSTAQRLSMVSSSADPLSWPLLQLLQHSFPIYSWAWLGAAWLSETEKGSVKVQSVGWGDLRHLGGPSVDSLFLKTCSVWQILS